MRRTLLLLPLLSACSREHSFRLGTDVVDTGCLDAPVLDAGPELLDLGTVGAGERADLGFLVKNTGGTAMGIDWIQDVGNGVGDDAAFTTALTPQDGAVDGADQGLVWILEPGGALRVDVAFTPNHDGPHWGGLVVSTAAAGDETGPQGVHMARQTARGRVLFTGSGQGVGGDPPEVFLVGGITPDVYAVEPGHSVRLQWMTYDPDGRYEGSPVSLRDQDGELHALEGWSIDWTAPTEEPPRGGFARSAGFVREDADGTQVSASTPVFVWPTGELDAPICP